MTRALAMIFCLALSSPALAAPTEDPRPLTEEVSDQVRAALPGELALLSLSLPGKERPAQECSISWPSPPKEGLISVLVELRGPKPEKLWARAELRAKRPALVANRDLYAGETLSAGDLTLTLLPRRAEEGLDLDPNALLGRRVLEDTAKGAALASSAVELPAPLAQGTALTISLRRGGLTVSTSGTLERAARPGERAAARLSTGRLIEGRLSADATLSIEEPR